MANQKTIFPKSFLIYYRSLNKDNQNKLIVVYLLFCYFNAMSKKKILNYLITTYLLVFTLTGCNGGEDLLDIGEDLANLIEGIERKPIDRSRLGINAFGNKPEFGSPCNQFSDVSNNLKIKYFRVLFNWNSNVQNSLDSPVNFSFYDEIVDCLPQGSRALVVVNGLPDWMSNSDNWIDGDVNTTFVELWFKKVINRYKNRNKIDSFQVWNEPNMPNDPENEILGTTNNPIAYLDLLAKAKSASEMLGSNKLIVNAATTAIAQGFSETLDYNKELVANGVLNFVDVFAIHYYGQQFERLLAGGIKDFLNEIPKTIWITESGIQGANKQLEYVEETWPFLRENVSGIDRIYHYQYASLTGADNAFGLRNLDGSNSDLYQFLAE